MYKRNNKVSSNMEELTNYFDGNDVYNSLLLVKLQDPGLPRDLYEIKTYEYRPDLIAKDYYGSTSYEGILMLQAGITLTNLVKGTVLRLIPKENIDYLLRSI